VYQLNLLIRLVMVGGLSFLVAYTTWTCFSLQWRPYLHVHMSFSVVCCPYRKQKQQAFVQRRSPEARWSQEEEPAEEESPGAPASPETRGPINTHPIHRNKSPVDTWGPRMFMGSQRRKRKTHLTVSIFTLALKQVPSHCLYFYCSFCLSLYSLLCCLFKDVNF